jgi:membrane fusion protein
MPPASRLFRNEVLRARAERLYGEISIAVPVAWQFIGFMLLAALLATIAFLSFASYGRVETVTGAIVLDRGVAQIVPPRPGVVSNMHVREGQVVGIGSPLVEIRSEQQLLAGSTPAARISESLAEQSLHLSQQSRAVHAASLADQARLRELATGLQRELSKIDEQISAQQRLVEVAAEELRDLEDLVGRGFISRRDVNARESVLLTRRQQLSQLQQNRATLSTRLAETGRNIVQAAAAAEADTAGLHAARSVLGRELAQAEASRGYTLNAPIAGTVTAVTARPGQAVGADQALLVLVPEKARTRVELYVPTRAAGFISAGDQVRITVDAFPYQRFGALDARIASVALATMTRPGADGSQEAVYLVTAELDRPYVQAFGRRQPLMPGMTLSARIIGERRSLLRWLFEPIFAVRDR